MIALKNVLVATDFGEAAAVALSYGRSLARTFGATLHVLHVLDDAACRTTAMAGYGIDVEPMQRELEESARTQLEALLPDEDRRELRAETVVLTSATPARTILQYATETHVNLIIVGTHGRTPLARALMGSVAERVVRSAPCPVLTVRPNENEFVLPDALQVVAKTAPGAHTEDLTN